MSQHNSAAVPNPPLPFYAGMFLISWALMSLEVGLTRIFSVTMWYHFSFMAVSLAMLGLTAGAVLVYILPRFFAGRRAEGALLASTLLFGFLILPCFLMHLRIPFEPSAALSAMLKPRHLAAGMAAWGVLVLPFVCGGAAVCLALTSFPGFTGRIYAADLIGAGAGCVWPILILPLSDGIALLASAAAIAGLAAAVFAASYRRKRFFAASLMFALILAVLAAGQGIGAARQQPPLRLTRMKGRATAPPLYEKWNAYSYVRVESDPWNGQPFGWGLSPLCRVEHPVRQLALYIDAAAGTVLTGYSGRPDEIGYLRYDISNLAHYLRRNAELCVIGVGGGRDILSALAFQQRRVVGLEINEAIVDLVTRRFGDFTGRLDQLGNVEFVHDEARSWLARQRRTFDVIQASLIDTWAAAAQGAFALTENSLYTVEAWRLFLNRLNPGGVLTFSRWYVAPWPAEIYRLMALAVAALRAQGVRNPAAHILLARVMAEQHGFQMGVGTILVGRDPFTEADVQAFEQACADLHFDVLFTPAKAADQVLKRFLRADGGMPVLDDLPLNVRAPTDNAPFFFHMLRFRDLLRHEKLPAGGLACNRDAVVVLVELLLIVSVLTALFVVVPLQLRRPAAGMFGKTALALFFAAIGLGFMLIEISQIQRLNLFLGHPTLGLVVALGGLLCASGLGSFFVQRILWDTSVIQRRWWWLGVAALGGLGVLVPALAELAQAYATPLRILLAAGMVGALGFILGMAFPLGMELAFAKRLAEMTPWFWGMNGAMSVLGSVLAVMLAMSFGITQTFWIGAAAYVVAGLALTAALKAGSSKNAN